MKKSYEIAKYLKFAVVIAAFTLSGVLYSCRSDSVGNTSQKENLKLQEVTTISVDSGDNDKKSIQNTEQGNLYVYVCGCVNAPGVYEAAQGTRVYQVLEMAGGFTDVADTAYLNMAEVIVDGQKLYIPEVGEESSIQQNESSLVNINKADKAQLMTLPGIGESKAMDIINYRNSSGGFKSIEDIKNVSGIKDAAFNKIKDLITV